MVYNVPDFASHSALTRHALGGWELATILDYSSGPSLTVFAEGVIDGAAGGISGTGDTQGAARPNRVVGQSCRAPAGSPKFQWLNPNAWTVDNYKLATFGTASVGECSGPGIANTDFSFHKNFKIGERVNLQFRMEFFNVFNTTQFQANSDGFTGIHVNLINDAVACNASNVGNSGSVCYGHAINTVGWSFGTNSRDGTAYGNQTFGQAQRDKGPREIQYSLKVEF